MFSIYLLQKCFMWLWTSITAISMITQSWLLLTQCNFMSQSVHTAIILHCNLFIPCLVL